MPAKRHDYGYSKRTVMYNFFDHHLDLNVHNIPYSEGYKENFVTVLAADDLMVFSKENPRPEGVLLGDDAVIKYLNIEVD